MISLEEIRKLSGLARIELNEKEKKQFQKDLEAVLGYVGKLKKVAVEGMEELVHPTEIINEMREDANYHKTGEYSDMILNQAPSKGDDRYFKVKKIL
jgi:aspartyl-tRNA(Asn)/glutamyl-tRNA(Gln) amidotransferase subunit C